jgi:hypothetical protein
MQRLRRVPQPSNLERERAQFERDYRDHADVTFIMKQHIQTGLGVDRQVATTLAALITGSPFASAEIAGQRLARAFAEAPTPGRRSGVSGSQGR